MKWKKQTNKTNWIEHSTIGCLGIPVSRFWWNETFIWKWMLLDKRMNNELENHLSRFPSVEIKNTIFRLVVLVPILHYIHHSIKLIVYLNFNWIHFFGISIFDLTLAIGKKIPEFYGAAFMLYFLNSFFLLAYILRLHHFIAQHNFNPIKLRSNIKFPWM